MKLLLDRERVTETYPNPYGDIKSNKRPNSKAKAFGAHGFKEIRATC